MITLKRYIEALEVVEEFHKQLEIISKTDSINKQKRLPVSVFNGAMIECKVYKGQNNFTVGKIYEIFDCRDAQKDYENCFYIMSNRGTKVRLTPSVLQEESIASKGIFFELKPRNDIDLSIVDDCFEIINKLAEKKAYQVIAKIQEQTK